MNPDHSPLRVLVTGGLGSIGSAVAQRFREGGAQVFVTTSRRPLADANTVFHLDLHEEEGVPRLAQQVQNRGLTFNCVVHCAHLFSEAKLHPRLHPQELLEGFRQNVLPAFQLAQWWSRTMRRSDFGRFIFLGSMASVRPTPGKLVYALEKNALTALVKTFNRELERSSIRFSIVHPGLVDTPQIRRRLPEKALAHIGETILSPRQVADLIVSIAIHPLEEVEDVYELAGDQVW